MTVTTGAGRIDVVAGAEYAQLGEATLSEVARRVLAVDDLHRATAVLQPVSYDIGTVSTCALLRAVGRATVGGRTARWSAFVKVLQSPLAWELLHVIPDHLRDRFVREFPWRLEIDALRSPVRSVLPDGLRMPELYAVHEPDDLHAALWMEDVDERNGPWSLDTFARAARLLGELAGRRPVGSEAAFGDPLVRLQPGFGLRMYAESRVKHESAQVFASDATWADPVLVAALDDAGEHGLRDDLIDALDQVDRWFGLVDALPATYVHGDASPQNLLIPVQSPQTFVVIDWGFNSPQSVGFDLGQLLLGLAHAGELGVGDLPAIHEAIVPAYCEGLARAGFTASRDEVLLGHVGSMMLRSGFTSLPFDRLGGPADPELRRLFGERVRLTRFLLDLTMSTLR